MFIMVRMGQGSETQPDSQPQFLHIQSEEVAEACGLKTDHLTMDLAVQHLPASVINTILPNWSFSSPCTRTPKMQMKH